MYDSGDEDEHRSRGHRSRRSDDSDSDDESFVSGTDFSLFSMSYIKLVFLMFLLFLFVNSDLFADKVLGNIDGTIEHDSPTSKGVFIQAVVYTMGFVAIDCFVRG
jgi:hypothetical protein